jgi:hypothetical protein
MKPTIHLFIFISFLILLLQSCNDSVLKPKVESKEGFAIQIGDKILFTLKDIDYYDHSSHLFYFKSPLSLYDYGNSKYWILNDGNIIYEGIFVSPKSCCINGDSTLIYDFNNQADFVLRLGRLFCDIVSKAASVDYRENESFIDALTDLDILHSGLECTIDSLRITGNKEVTLYYKICNNDSWNYYFPDPDKIPIDSDYRIDRTLRLTELNGKSGAYYRSMYNGTYLPFGKKDTSMLMLIKTGEAICRTTKYTISNNIIAGNYLMYLTIPGLGVGYHYPKERELKDNRIWLGEIEVLREIEIK